MVDFTRQLYNQVRIMVPPTADLRETMFLWEVFHSGSAVIVGYRRAWHHETAIAEIARLTGHRNASLDALLVPMEWLDHVRLDAVHMGPLE